MRCWSSKWLKMMSISLLVAIPFWFLLRTYSIYCTNWSCSALQSEPSLKLTETSKPTSRLSDPNGIEICHNMKFSKPKEILKLISSPQLGNYGTYPVVYYYLRGSRSYGINDSVTYTTHVTPEYFDKMSTLVERWDGPISVALFVPFTDFCRAIHRIVYLRNCDKADYKGKVTWHIFWIRDSPPPVHYLLVPDETDVDCSKLATDISTNEHLKNTWRTAQKLPYPINAARNIARMASNTSFVLSSDVELYPSLDFTSQFMKFIKTTNTRPVKQITLANESAEVSTLVQNPKVYVVPVFEVEETIPNTKEELLDQYASETAVYFHKNFCSDCYKFPGLSDWLKTAGEEGTLQAMSWSYWRYPYHHWEPIYVGSKQEPLYVEDFNWEGKLDKVSQMPEMCLKDYQFHLLDRAFLIHAPGIKTAKKGKPAHEEWQKPFIKSNAELYKRVKAKLSKKYGERNMICLKE